ncbi:MAG: RNA polymerase sigma-54 factor [Granulosicoccus sp.]
MGLKQGLHLKQLQKLSPQQIQLMKLLQVPTIALEARIKEELEANPALEEGEDDDQDEDLEIQNEDDDNDEEQSDDEMEMMEKEEDEKREDEFDIQEYMDDDDIPDYKLYANNSSPDEEEKSAPITGGRSFQDGLLEQLGMRKMDAKSEVVGKTLIGNLDDDGYLRRDLIDIVDDLAFGQNITVKSEDLESVLKVIQEFDPPGVGARNLQECLKIQLQKKENTFNVIYAIKVVEEMMDEFSKKHYQKISDRLELDDEGLREVLGEILKLNPRPGNSSNEVTRVVAGVVPDFIIVNNDGELDLSLNSRNAPSLKLSKDYKRMIQEYQGNKKNSSKSQKEAAMFAKQKLDGAKWFIDAIQQRQITLLHTMDAIMQYQKEYFLTGDETKLKPMILKDIAEIIGMDISTVSRVANSKYVQTQYGTFLLKSFFSESLTTESGEEVSSREVKKILEEAIGAENKSKPLSDEKLAAVLKEKGYTIARRTVAKYREQLNLPVARLRKEL